VSPFAPHTIVSPEAPQTIVSPEALETSALLKDVPHTMVSPKSVPQMIVSPLPLPQTIVSPDEPQTMVEPDAPRVPHTIVAADVSVVVEPQTIVAFLIQYSERSVTLMLISPDAFKMAEPPISDANAKHPAVELIAVDWAGPRN